MAIDNGCLDALGRKEDSANQEFSQAVRYILSRKDTLIRRVNLSKESSETFKASRGTNQNSIQSMIDWLKR